MTDKPKLGVIHGSKEEVCDYCGAAEHRGEWSCPRIKSVCIDYNDEKVTIIFQDSRIPPANVAGG